MSQALSRKNLASRFNILSGKMRPEEVEVWFQILGEVQNEMLAVKNAPIFLHTTSIGMFEGVKKQFFHLITILPRADMVIVTSELEEIAVQYYVSWFSEYPDDVFRAYQTLPALSIDRAKGVIVRGGKRLPPLEN